jgi:GGDEF domain-containing protein
MLRVAQLLLNGIGEHAIRCDPDEYVRFRESMEQSAAALAESHGGAETMTLAEGAVQALEEYTRRTAQSLRVRGSELQGMVKMLTAAIGEISAAGQENAGRLRQIEGQISSATQIEDVLTIKAQLAICLDQIRKEADRQKMAASNAAERLRQDLQRAQAWLSDPVTGLPARAQAMDFIKAACESEERTFAVAIAVDRLPAVNTAFGADVGDQLLRYFSGYVRRNLPPDDRLFRWTGASLLALVLRSERIETVRDEIGRLMEQKLEYPVRTATRSVKLPVTARWAVFPMMASPQLLTQKIDGFAAHSAKD